MRSFVLHQVVTNDEQAKGEREKQKGQSDKENVIHACLHLIKSIQLWVKLGLRGAGRASRKGQDAPAEAQGPLTVETTLWYRLALQEFVTYSLNLDVILPPVVMEQNKAMIAIR